MEAVAVRRPEFKKDDAVWRIASYERSKGDGLHFCSGSWWRDCIPLKGNEDIVGTDLNPKDISSLKWGDRCLVSNDCIEWKPGVFFGFCLDCAEKALDGTKFYAVTKENVDRWMEPGSLNSMSVPGWRFMRTAEQAEQMESKSKA